MSKILQLAQEIENELSQLHMRINYAENELTKEKKRRKDLLEKIKDIVEEELHNE